MVVARDFTHFVQQLDGGMARIDLAVDGMRCAGCMAAIEGGLTAVPNVTRARVNLTNKRVAVEWPDGTVDPACLIDTLAELGYPAYPFQAGRLEAAEAAEAKFLLRCLGVAAFAAMNVMLLSVSVWSGNLTDITAEQRDFFHWLSALVALPAIAYAGQPFFRSAVRALVRGQLNMDVPITIGVVLALAMSVAETLHHAEHAYFDSAIMLLTFLLAGRFLDQNMRARARSFAGNLAALKADTVVKFISDQDIQEVPAASVRPGDVVLVRPGERVGVDGLVIAGRSDVDQSLITGETTPVAVGPESTVYAGTLNGSGTLRLWVSAGPAGSLLDTVIRLVEQAAQVRSRYVRLSERAAKLYAPMVHLTALLTMLGWLAAGASWHDAVVTAIAVLIITCPCALGLAIPAVQVVASGALFRSGVLLNAPDAIERLAAAQTVVFDKTGTLTLPDAAVVNATSVPPEMLALAGRLALASHHPLAAAVARAAGAKWPLDGASEEPGRGVRAEVDGVEVRIGSAEFCDAQCQVEDLALTDPQASAIAFRHGDARCVFAVRQQLRIDAVSVMGRLKRAGLGIEILSGDRAAAVAPVARELGVEQWHAAQNPADKIARIAALKREGRNVLMVGDGLNDAPSLAAADVSLSPTSAVHLTQAAADALVLGERLTGVADAIAIARRARRVMQENLCLAIVYNAIAVPVAILGFATPLIAALAMSGSSLLVTANALRAR